MSANPKPITFEQFLRSAVNVGLSANAAYDAARKLGYRVRRQSFYRRFREQQRKALDL